MEYQHHSIFTKIIYYVEKRIVMEVFEKNIKVKKELFAKD